MTARRQPADRGKGQPDGPGVKRAGRGKPASQDQWPPSGPTRDWLAYCDQVRQANGTPSLRALQERMHLAFARVGELLRSELPVDEEQARALLKALGAEDGNEVDRGIALYGKAARAEPDRARGEMGLSAWWPRSNYVELVRERAPGQLLGREAELAELADWCASGDEAFVWWQAVPWAGKSALMQWLVLNPPPGTWVISFFVNGRLASQSDSTAFTDALLDQLAAITGDKADPGPTALARDGYCHKLLAKAAAQTARAGRRLVLVVDGLDEDRGSSSNSGLSSIARRLRRLPDGLRVIVAGRPAPPLPGDVQDDSEHPLRRCRIRLLDPSPHAAEVGRRAREELNRVLGTDGDRHDGLGRQVLGLITASGGGLCHRDLQELTGRAAFEIDQLLDGEFGRVIAGQDGPHAGNEVLTFTHEALREEAAGRLGTHEITRFAGRVRDWADSYQYTCWPERTPAYLLNGYPRMLAGTGDIARLADLAADPARHHRMLDATGGDAATLAEIAAAHALISTSTSPDLLAALRLARQRDQLTDQNTHIPAQLPTVWAALGQPVRAEGLARSIINIYPDVQIQALAAVAVAVARAGDFDRARELAAQAEQMARSISNPYTRGRSLAGIAAAAARAGDYDRAERIARSITDSDEQARVLAGVAVAAARADDHDRAERIARSISTDPYDRVQVLPRVAAAAAGAGGYDRAERIARSITDSDEQARVLAGVAMAAAGAGDYDRARELAVRAERIARSVINLDKQARVLAGVAAAAAGAGDYDRAERIARSITDPYQMARALAGVAAAVVRTGDFDRTRELVAGTERIVLSITDLYARARALVGVAAAAAGAGDYDSAERIARSITDSGEQARVLAGVAMAAAGAGDYDSAERIARSVTAPYEQAHALAGVAAAVARAGDFDRARELAADAERIARSIVGRAAQERTLAVAAAAAAGAGDYDRAERIARSITDSGAQVQVLVEVAAAAAEAENYERARKLAVIAERFARSVTDPNEQVRVLAGVVAAVAGAGDFDRARELAADAEQTASSITDSYEQAQILPGVAAAAAGAGDFDRAERIARSITDSGAQAHALAGVATVAARAGDFDRARELAADAERIARSIVRWSTQVRPLAGVAAAVAGAGDFDRAERIARSITDPNEQAHALAEVAAAAAGAGDLDRARKIAADAERIAQSIVNINPDVQVQALAGVAKAAAGAGDYDRAERIAWSITDPYEQVRVLAGVVAAVARAGDFDRARELAADAEQTASSMTDSYEQPQVLAVVAAAVAGAGDFDRAERIARSITDPGVQAHALAGVAKVAAETEPGRARSCIAGALAAGRWTISLEALALTDPVALSTFAGELIAPSGPTRTQDNGPLSGTSPAARRQLWQGSR